MPFLPAQPENELMPKSNKVIITVAPTSNFHGKEANPALPIQPDEIGQDVHECYNAGACLAHLHARDVQGLQTNDARVFRRINAAVRARCNIIIQNSIAPANGPNAGVAVDGLQTLDAYPEMASLDMGIVAVTQNGRDEIVEWTRGFLVKAATMMQERGIKPELEIFNDSHIENARYLIAKGLLTPPFSFSFVMGMHKINHASVAWSPRRLLAYIDDLPEQSLFSTLGIGPSQVAATTTSLLFGGGARVGFEDNVYYRKGELAKNNAKLVERAVLFAREFGLEPATPEEARGMLGIASLNSADSIERRFKMTA
jgi:3-keto-5-aminohexanoate cleavage enzyme